MSHYNRLINMPQDALVLELTELVGLIADRGSAVSSASQRRRIDGFESALLRELKSAYCSTNQPRQGILPWPGMENIVRSAARSQRLSVDGEDVAEMSALTQHWVERLPRSRWCHLSTMSDAP